MRTQLLWVGVLVLLAGASCATDLGGTSPIVAELKAVDGGGKGLSKLSTPGAMFKVTAGDTCPACGGDMGDTIEAIKAHGEDCFNRMRRDWRVELQKRVERFNQRVEAFLIRVDAYKAALDEYDRYVTAHNAEYAAWEQAAQVYLQNKARVEQKVQNWNDQYGDKTLPEATYNYAMSLKANIQGDVNRVQQEYSELSAEQNRLDSNADVLNNRAAELNREKEELMRQQKDLEAEEEELNRLMNQ
ncbi:MAG: hypothetical protein ACYTAF_16925 [Planctomycetota bacterium]|jgi:chromosome segregation ATPase